MKVVLDTNIVVSSIYGGNPRLILDLLREEKITVLVSQEILMEFAETLEELFGQDERAKRLIELLHEHGKMIIPKEKFKVIKNDPSDDKFLDCAVAGKAKYIVSGDKKHLQPLKIFRGIPILNPRDFLESLNS